MDALEECHKQPATLLGAAEAVRRTIKVKIIPVRVPVQEQLVADLRSQLGAEEYARAYKLGEVMSFEEALSYG